MQSKNFLFAHGNEGYYIVIEVLVDAESWFFKRQLNKAREKWLWLHSNVKWLEKGVHVLQSSAKVKQTTITVYFRWLDRIFILL